MYTYEVTIREVLDGDTVKVDINLGFELWLRDQNIRFFGLDTPEIRTTDVVEKKFGLLTKEVVERYLPIGSTQQMVSIKSQRGKFGRILGEFLVTDPEIPNHRFNLNRFLIEKHLAVPYDGESRNDVQEQHHKNRLHLMKKGIVI